MNGVPFCFDQPSVLGRRILHHPRLGILCVVLLLMAMMTVTMGPMVMHLLLKLVWD